MSGLLSDVRVLTIVVTVGAFLVTFAGHKAFTRASMAIASLRRPGDGSAPTPTGEPNAASPAPAPPEPKAPESPRDEDGFGFAASTGTAGATASPAPAPSRAPPKPTTSAGRAAAPVLSKAHPPQRNAFREVDAAPTEHAAPATTDVDPAEWERLMREVMSEESILAENRDRLSKTRSLKSLLANLRDRDLLVERGHRIGRSLHATSYVDLSEKLTANRVCEEAQFRTLQANVMHVRLVGTAMGRESPVIGVAACFIEAGVIAGALENLEGCPYHVREVRCAVKGDPACEFRADPVAEEAAPGSLYDDLGERGEGA